MQGLLKLNDFGPHAMGLGPLHAELVAGPARADIHVLSGGWHMMAADG